ncbi:ankyrin repeat protein [Planoprotostelium fungivorum]|uniref:Ankyrin repeat protein n=1 Tax=Planoprotostelium fungivorum TaxID=1890364 RepID=A0A2P6NX12_9EUKA|nr:ankyrin repeat protein [Planoprotostelium fungivorum]
MAARTPPKFVSKDYIHTYEQVKGNFEEKFRLFDQLREEENWYREVFAQQRDSEVLNDPHLCLVPAHDVPSDFFKIVEQSEQEKNLPRIFGEEWAETRRQSKASNAIVNEDDEVEEDQETPEKAEIPAAVRTDTASSIVSESEFHKQFDIFTEGQFRYFNWDNVFAAGGSILAALMPVPEEHAAKNSTRRNYFHKLMYSNSDIDLFIYGLNEEDANKKLVEVYESIKDNLPVEAICFRSKYAVTIVSRYPFRHIQIVLRLYKSPAEILMGFDVDVCSVGFDGKKVWMTPRAHRALTHRYNTVDMERRSPSYETRLTKYAERGFSVVVPSLDRTRIDPQIFERRFDQLQGLPRLLLMEAMPDVNDRISYKKMMRKLKLQPAIDDSRPTVWNRLTGQEEDIETEDEEEEEEEEEEDYDDEYYYARKKASESDYSSVFLPWGDDFTAEKIRKLMYTKDMVLNSEWYDPSKKYHTHPCFFGTASEVLRDCCGHCPPVPAEINMAEEPYVQGVLTWVTVNPGAQGKIGSFHPITEGDWTEGAYIIDLNIQLLQAVNLNDVGRVKDLLQQGVDVDGRDPYGRTSLMLACMGGCVESAEVLIQRGARISSHTPDGRTGLMLAVENGNAKVVELLLKRKDEIDVEWKERHSGEDSEPSKSEEEGEEGEGEEEEGEEEGSEASSQDEDFKKIRKSLPKAGGVISEEFKDDLNLNAGSWDRPTITPLDIALQYDYVDICRLLIARPEVRESKRWLSSATKKTFSFLLDSLTANDVNQVEEFQWFRLSTADELRDIESWYDRRGLQGRWTVFPSQDQQSYPRPMDPIARCMQQGLPELKEEQLELIEMILRKVHGDDKIWKREPRRIKECLRQDLKMAVEKGYLKVVELFLGYDLLGSVKDTELKSSQSKERDGEEKEEETSLYAQNLLTLATQKFTNTSAWLKQAQENLKTAQKDKEKLEREREICGRDPSTIPVVHVEDKRHEDPDYRALHRVLNTIQPSTFWYDELKFHIESKFPLPREESEEELIRRNRQGNQNWDYYMNYADQRITQAMQVVDGHEKKSRNYHHIAKLIEEKMPLRDVQFKARRADTWEELRGDYLPLFESIYNKDVEKFLQITSGDSPLLAGVTSVLTNRSAFEFALETKDPQMIGTFLRVVQLQSLSKEKVEEVQKKQLPFNNFDLLNQKIRVGDFVDKKGRARSSESKRVEGPKARDILSRVNNWDVTHRSVETLKAVLEAFPEDPKWVTAVINATGIYKCSMEDKNIMDVIYLFLDAQRTAPKPVKQQLYEGLDISGKKSEWAGEHHMQGRAMCSVDLFKRSTSRVDILLQLHEYSKRYPGCFQETDPSLITDMTDATLYSSLEDKEGSFNQTLFDTLVRIDSDIDHDGRGYLYHDAVVPAIRSGHFKTLAALIQRGAKLSGVIHDVIAAGKIEQILPLLSDEEVTRLNENRDTALHTAVRYAPRYKTEDTKNYEEVVKKFMRDPRIDLQHRNIQGYTAMEIAVREERHWIAQILMEKTSEEQLKRENPLGMTLFDMKSAQDRSDMAQANKEETKGMRRTPRVLATPEEAAKMSETVLTLWKKDPAKAHRWF